MKQNKFLGYGIIIVIFLAIFIGFGISLEEWIKIILIYIGALILVLLVWLAIEFIVGEEQ